MTRWISSTRISRSSSRAWTSGAIRGVSPRKRPLFLSSLPPNLLKQPSLQMCPVFVALRSQGQGVAWRLHPVRRSGRAGAASVCRIGEEVPAHRTIGHVQGLSAMRRCTTSSASGRLASHITLRSCSTRCLAAQRQFFDGIAQLADYGSGARLIRPYRVVHGSWTHIAGRARLATDSDLCGSPCSA